jgi:hypothetical protein
MARAKRQARSPTAMGVQQWGTQHSLVAAASAAASHRDQY